MPKLSVQSFHEGLGRELNQTSNLELANNGDRATKLLMNHEAKDAHHGSTAIVQLNGTLGQLGLLIKSVPAKVKGTVAEVTRELRLSRHILHHSKLQDANKRNNLEEASLGDGVRARDGSPAIGEGIKGVSSVVNVSGQVDAVAGHNLTKERKLCDTAVLHLHVTEAVEPLLVGISEHAEGIKETKRGLGSKLRLESHVQGGGGLAGLGRGKGGGRAGEEGGDGELHVGDLGLVWD
mmetsp:Transcript_11611/g.24221  ORF Transcript_11611/g.24221 Transcript_11611/m.24221 type:complete len:236 (-) Transcript_11611:63-770(-)